MRLEKVAIFAGSMGRLIDEIADFLEGNGIGCGRQVCGGFEVRRIDKADA